MLSFVMLCMAQRRGLQGMMLESSLEPPAGSRSSSLHLDAPSSFLPQHIGLSTRTYSPPGHTQDTPVAIVVLWSPRHNFARPCFNVWSSGSQIRLPGRVASAVISPTSKAHAPSQHSSDSLCTTPQPQPQPLARQRFCAKVTTILGQPPVRVCSSQAASSTPPSQNPSWHVPPPIPKPNIL
jgi:hypothetical protein